MCLERLDQVATDLLPALLFAKGDAGLGRLRIEMAFGLHVVQGDVAPATRVKVNRFQEHSLSDQFAGVPGHRLEDLGILASGVEDFRAVVGAEGHVGVVV